MIRLNTLRYLALILTSFFLPLEDFWLFFFGFDTIFKPFRIFFIVFILLNLRNSFILDTGIKTFLLLFLYGSFMVYYRYFTGSEVSFANFDNEILQIIINVTFYISLFNYPLTKNKINSLLWAYIIGMLFNFFNASSGVDYSLTVVRKSGFFSNPNSLGFAATLGIMFIIYLQRISKEWVQYLVLTPGMFILLYLINISGSRTALGLVFIIIGYSLFWFFKNSRNLFYFQFTILLSIVIYIGISGITIYAVERQNLKDEKGAENDRTALALAGIDAGINANFMGLGVGQFSYIENFYPAIVKYSEKIAFERMEKNEGLVSHNTYTQTFAEYGIFGLILLLIFIIKKLKFVSYSLKRKEPLYFLFAGTLLLMLFYAYFHVIFLSQIFWFFLAFLKPKIYHS